MKLHGMLQLLTLLVGTGAALAVSSRRPIRSLHTPKEMVENYEVVSPVVTCPEGEKPHPSVMHVHIEAQDDRYTIVLKLNDMLIPSNFNSLSYDKDGREVITKGHVNCFYQGWVEGHPEWRATMSTCTGLKGTFGNYQNKKELFHLEPLDRNDPFLEQPHALYPDTELEIDEGSCGCNDTHKVDEIGEVPMPDIEDLRLKRQVNGFWIVELIIVNDFRQYDSQGQNLTNTVSRALSITNEVDSVYQALSIRVVLIQSITWTSGDQISIVTDPDVVLPLFRTYKQTISTLHDCMHLVTGIDLDGDTLGLAYIQVMCGSGCVGLSQDGGRGLTEVRTTVAHELGHNFNMNHDDGSCTCTDSAGYCIMEAISIDGNLPMSWSSCSVGYLNDGFQLSNPLNRCLGNQPTTMVSDPVCGNGLREGDEVCDCGSTLECTDPCCNAATCQLVPGAECSARSCCNTQCQFISAGTTCRASTGSCDITEYCSGSTSECPNDESVLDGTACTRNNVSAFCYSGECPNLVMQCQAAWTVSSSNGGSVCFNLNTRGDRFGNCIVHETNPLTYTACTPANVGCGLLHCINTGNFQLSNANYFLGAITPLQSPQCRSYFSTDADAVGAGFVSDGIACGAGNACFNRQCVLPSQLTIHTCPTGSNSLLCSGNGQCNNNGGCSCSVGFSGATCQTAGVPTNECLTNNGGCAQTCTDTLDSFVCNCTTGYNIASNGLGCNVIDCGTPSSLNNGGQVTVSLTTFGSFSVYTCPSGYVLSAPSSIRSCMENGNWSGSDPTCDLAIDCGTPSSLNNGGQVTVSLTTFGSFSVYTCLSGYVLSAPSSIRSCMENGNWSGSDPTCDPADNVGLYVGIALPVGLVMIAATVLIILLCFVIHKKRAKKQKQLEVVTYQAATNSEYYEDINVAPIISSSTEVPSTQESLYTTIEESTDSNSNITQGDVIARDDKYYVNERMGGINEVAMKAYDTTKQPQMAQLTYDCIANPSPVSHDPPTILNLAHGDVTTTNDSGMTTDADRLNGIAGVAMIRNEAYAGVRQSIDIPTTENEAYTSMTADTES